MAHLQDILMRLEPAFLLVAGIAFFRSGAARRLPALATYFVVRGVQAAFLEFVLSVWGTGMPACDTLRYNVYFYGYWISYLISAIAIFFVVQEVFKRIMEPVPGLRRLGLMAFRWVSIVSAVVCVGAIALPAAMMQASTDRLAIVCLQTARCVSVMELCLLAFLALSIHALGRSFRSRLFGIGLGFGVQAGADLVFTALAARYPGLTSTAALGLQMATTVVLVTWSVYFIVPEPAVERKMVVLPPQSMLARWNSLAKGLGQLSQPAVAGAPTGFFLQDIEGVVDRVLAKNPVIISH
ncbi:MAG TPA: hypothetical protein VHX13_12785 [Acidobacteriaceae bacterium]|jgi:hypothetical protein|nr:hypothetical protein [Acidobacteriaceae bacterium]